MVWYPPWLPMSHTKKLNLVLKPKSKPKRLHSHLSTLHTVASRSQFRPQSCASSVVLPQHGSPSTIIFIP